MTVDAVVKLGGSLLSDDRVKERLGVLAKVAEKHRLVVVPGGGPFADVVREASARHDAGASAAHWMAILAMDQHAHLLDGLSDASQLVRRPAEIEEAVNAGRLTVLAPYTWLREADPLPHGWHVTSDSLAAWVAARLGARRLVLLKSVEGASDGRGEILGEVDRRSPQLNGVVDEHFAQALEPSLDCWILSGRHPERLAALLSEGRTRGTRVR
jgi:5-(aminomethyl)-3-furanmethanol phosphate kinase